MISPSNVESWDVGLFGVKETPGLIPCTVTLNGEPHDDVVRGDTVDGWLECFVREAGGRYKLDGDGRSIAIMRKCGRVRLVPPAGLKP